MQKTSILWAVFKLFLFEIAKSQPKENRLLFIAGKSALYCDSPLISLTKLKVVIQETSWLTLV